MVLVNLPEKEIKKIENDIYDIAFEIEMGTDVDISPIIKNIVQYEYWADVLMDVDTPEELQALNDMTDVL